MTETPSTGHPDDAAAHERSGPDVASAIGAAEHDSVLHETHTHPERTKSGEAHVERAQGDPAMTAAPGGDGDGSGDGDGGAGGPSAAAAQSVRGARVSDRIAAGEPQPGE